MLKWDFRGFIRVIQDTEEHNVYLNWWKRTLWKWLCWNDQCWWGSPNEESCCASSDLLEFCNGIAQKKSWKFTLSNNQSNKKSGNANFKDGENGYETEIKVIWKILWYSGFSRRNNVLRKRKAFLLENKTETSYQNLKPIIIYYLRLWFVYFLA
jgi:hypothetical protein